MIDGTNRLAACSRTILPLVLVLFCNLTVRAPADDDLSLLIADWESREARFETGHIEFQSTEIYPPKTTLGLNGRPNLKTVERIQKHKISGNQRWQEPLIGFSKTQERSICKPPSRREGRPDATLFS